MNEVEKLRYLILAAQREGNRRLIHVLRPLGVTPSQAEVLRVLADHGPQSLMGLGGMLVCDSGTNPSRLVDRLVLAGFVERNESATDRRHVELTLTAAGRKKQIQVGAAEATVLEPMAGTITSGELAAAVAVLEKLTDGSPSGDALQQRLAADARSKSAGST